jgi:hypothetical protein
MMVTEFLYQQKPESKRGYDRNVVRIPEKEGENKASNLFR